MIFAVAISSVVLVILDREDLLIVPMMTFLFISLFLTIFQMLFGEKGGTL